MAAGIMRAIEPYLRYEDYGYAARALQELLMQEGVEVLTDHDRLLAGLPSRDGRGWTADELAAYERRRLDLMFAPPTPMVVESGDKLPQELRSGHQSRVDAAPADTWQRG